LFIEKEIKMNKKAVIGWVLRVLKRILVEFWIPALATLIWFFAVSNSTYNGAGIFFVSVSWITAQIFRIIKQQRVEGEFDLVKSKLGELVGRIEKQTEKVVGFSTGGDSIAYFTAWELGNDVISLHLKNISDYPVFDIRGEWIDLDEFGGESEGKRFKRNEFTSAELHPKYVVEDLLVFKMTGKDRLRINIFYRSRTRGYTCQVRAFREGTRFVFAVQNKSKEYNDIVISPNFPGYEGGDREAVFETV
jgi:hypothetical protein